ncbi:MAG TPA: hypothetical protein VGK02_09790 [Candidatus Aquicultor sp.]|jgi:hypothetical protein
MKLKEQDVILTRRNVGQLCKIALILLGIVMVISLSGCRGANDSEKTVSQGKIDLGKQEIEYKVKEKPPTSEPANSAPISYEGKSPRFVNAGEPFTCNFSIQNNTDIPIIAASIAFKDCSMIKGIGADNGWSYNPGGNLALPSVSIQNIDIERGSSLQSKASIMILEPGTYQFEMLPSVRAGSWKALGAYVVTVIVNDTNGAQQTRLNIEAAKNNAKELDQINSDIRRVDFDIDRVTSEIENRKNNIDEINGEIKGVQEEIADDPEHASDHSVQIEDYKNRIQDNKTTLDEAQKQLRSLTDQKNKLLRRKQQLEASSGD